MDKLLGNGRHPLNHSFLAKETSGILSAMGRAGGEADGEREGIGRCDLYGEGGSQVSRWAPLEDKPCEYPDLLKRFPQTSYSWPLH